MSSWLWMLSLTGGKISVSFVTSKKVPVSRTASFDTLEPAQEGWGVYSQARDTCYCQNTFLKGTLHNIGFLKYTRPLISQKKTEQNKCCLLIRSPLFFFHLFFFCLACSFPCKRGFSLSFNTWNANKSGNIWCHSLCSRCCRTTRAQRRMVRIVSLLLRK